VGEWFANGRVFELILVGMAFEGAGLVLFQRVKGRGIRPARLLPNLASGMCLLLAMSATAGRAWWGWISLALLGALIFHALDLMRAWK